MSWLHGKVRMAIVTRCDRDLFQLAHRASNLLDFFETVVTIDECPNPKPHPGLYLAGLKALGLKPESCLAVEDSPRGLASARTVGIPCIVVSTDLTRHLDFMGALSVKADVSGILQHFSDQKEGKHLHNAAHERMGAEEWSGYSAY